jgi:2-dehydropantoate 2-reductase
VLVWGDGAVGRGLAVALSRNAEVILVGPPGCSEGIVEVVCTGAIRGRARLPLVRPASAPAADSVLAALKAYDISGAAEDIRRTGCPVVCLSNGMGLEEEWGGPACGVEYAVVLGGFRRAGDGLVETHPGGIIAARSGKAAELLEGAVDDLVLADSVAPWRWAKWLLNSSLNPVAALAGAANDELAPAGLDMIVREMQAEMAPAVPAACRAWASAKALEMGDYLFANSSNRCSMLGDLDAGRRTEIEFLTGLAVRRLPPGGCPVCRAVYLLMRARCGSNA